MTRYLGKRESGQGLVEYALILLLIAVAAVGALAAFGGLLLPAYETIVSSW